MPPAQSSLVSYSAVNCSIPSNPPHVAYLCCLAAGAAWSSNGPQSTSGWCQLEADEDKIMREYLWRWDDCASRAAAINTTLAAVLEASEAMCVPAQAASDRNDDNFGIVFLISFLVACTVLFGLFVASFVFDWP